MKMNNTLRNAIGNAAIGNAEIGNKEIENNKEFKKRKPASCQSPLKREFQIVGKKLQVNPRDVVKNSLLAALSTEDLQLLIPHLEFVYISSNKQLFEYGEKISCVYFPTTALIALLYFLSDGGMTEIAVVGHDGMLGISALLGDAALGTAVVQSAGYAYKLNVDILKNACDSNKNLQRILMRYTQVLFGQLAQNSVSSRHCPVSQQLARWLLNRQDRLPTNVLKITQAMIANMLGVRRESITAAASRLQQEGLIEYRRGSIKILNRHGLEKYAGECYMVTRQELDLIMCGETF